MKQAAAILSGVILISFFLPWMQVDVSSNFMDHSTTASLARIINDEWTGGYYIFLWAIPLLALGGLVYSIVDRKNGYTWLTLTASIFAFCASAVFLAADSPQSSNAYYSSGSSTLIGGYLSLWSALPLWIISIMNNAKNYKQYKKTCLLHVLLPIGLFIASLLILGSATNADNIDNLSLTLTVASPFVLGFAAILFLSSIIIFILAKTAYKHAKQESDKNEPVEIEPEKDPTILQHPEGNIIIKKKQLYWVAGVIALLLTGWFIYSRMDLKGDSSEDYKAIFYNKYKEYPDKSMVLDEKRLAFIKGAKSDDSKKISICILENKKKNPGVLKTIELDKWHSVQVDTVWIEHIAGKEYLYLENLIGGGSMGNFWTDFSLYEMDGDASYILSYQFYRENSSALSEFDRSKSLDGKPQLMEFLKEKMRASEYYKMDGFFTFIDEFCSDREFQLSRIKFPVSYRREEVTNESDIDENTYFDGMDNIYYKEVPVSKSEWRILGKDAFTTFHDSNTNYFARWEKVSPDEIRFSSGWIDSEYDVGAVFKKIKGKWYLTRFS